MYRLSRFPESQAPLAPFYCCAVIGHSGSGKTTLLNLIAGIITPSNGAIRVGEVDVYALRDAGRRGFRISSIGFVFQDFEPFNYLTVFDNIIHPYRITSALSLDDSTKQRAAGLAEDMGIGISSDEKPTIFPSEKSKGPPSDGHY